MKKIFLILSAAIIASCSTTVRYSNTKYVRPKSSGQSVMSEKVIYGKASYYADKFHGRKTANGETFDMYDYTAAHKELPFNTMIKVTNLNNGKTVVVRINDRGPFIKGREIDLSKGAAEKLDMIKAGVVDVKMEIIH